MERIMLKCTSKKYGVEDVEWIGSVAGYCEHSNEDGFL
jgi:hypothetical protein